MPLRSATRILIPVLLPLLGNSCVHFREQPLSAEKGRADFASRTMEDGGLQAFLAQYGASSGNWDVNRLALVAVYFHPDMALARAEYDETTAGLQTARMRPNPVLTFSPQYASYRAPVFTPWFIGGNAAFPIETAGKRSKRIAHSLALAEAARWRVSARAWAARSRVRVGLLEVFSARENARLLEAEQALHEDAIRKLAAQMEAGDVSPFELTQARLMLNRTRLALQDNRRNAATAQTRLASALGLPFAALGSVRLDFSSFHRLPLPTSALRNALMGRADLMGLLAEYAATEAALKLELSRQYPDINPTPGYDYNSGQNRWQIGVNFILPLNQNRGPIAEAVARRQTAEKRFLARQAAIQGELDSARAAYDTSREKAATAALLAGEAEHAADTSQKMVEAGNISALELTRRRIEASAAKLALLTAQIEAQTAAGLLEDAAQSPFR
jgi:outer membrane protein TolC